jgi:membrane protease YdiL (CAAX protease family)
MLRSSSTPRTIMTLTEQTATILEFVLVFVGLGFLVWLLLSPAGRAVRLRAPALPAWDVRPTDFLFLAWLVVALGFFGYVLVRSTVGAALRSRPEGATLDLVVSGSMFPNGGAILAWVVMRVMRRRSPPGEGGIRWSRASVGASVRDAALTFLAVLPLVTGVGLLWENLLDAVGLSTARQEVIDYVTQAKTPLLLGVMVVLSLLIAPIGEEMVFRAGLFRFLRTRVPRWLAFSVSAGMFALLHLNWTSFLPLFVFGLVIAYAYERTGRIAVPMLAHALFNLNSLLLVLSHAPV